MFKRIESRVRPACVALGVVSSICTTAVFADTVTVSPVAWSSALDGGGAAHPVLDGQFDSLIPGSILYVKKLQGTKYQAEMRAAFEFVLPDAVLQPGTTIHNISLTVPAQSPAPSYDALSFFGYVADNTLTLSDFSGPALVPMGGIFGWSGAYAYLYPSSYFVQLFPGSGNHRIGVVTAASWGTSVVWGAAATMQIDYTPPTGSAPNLTVLAPADGAQYSAANNINLQATLSDAEDGNGREWSISWSSNISGFLGTGGNLSVTLPAGTHLITAQVTDLDGNTVEKGRLVTVQ